MGALHRLARRKSGYFCHVPDKANSTHLRNKSVALRHVANLGAQFSKMRANFFSEDARCAREWRVEAKQCIDQSGFARAIRPEQTNKASRKGPVQPVEDDPWPQFDL